MGWPWVRGGADEFLIRSLQRRVVGRQGDFAFGVRRRSPRFDRIRGRRPPSPLVGPLGTGPSGHAPPWNIDDGIVGHAIDDQVTRETNSVRRIDMVSDQTRRVRVNTRLTRNFAGAEPTRNVTNGFHGCEERNSVAPGRLWPVLTRTVPEDAGNLTLRFAHNPIGQSTSRWSGLRVPAPSNDQAGAGCLRRKQSVVTAGLRIGETGLDSGANVVFLGLTIVDQACHRLFD